MQPSIGLGASEEKFVVAAGRADLSWWHQLMPGLQGLAQVLQQLLHLLPLGNKETASAAALKGTEGHFSP